jgi:hypothetical protein
MSRSIRGPQRRPMPGIPVPAAPPITKEQKMTIDEMIEVLQAVKDGKRIQRGSWATGWHDTLLKPSFNFDFRVKTQPKEYWIVDSDLAGFVPEVYSDSDAAYNRFSFDPRVVTYHVREVVG